MYIDMNKDLQGVSHVKNGIIREQLLWKFYNMLTPMLKCIKFLITKQVMKKVVIKLHDNFNINKR